MLLSWICCFPLKFLNALYAERSVLILYVLPIEAQNSFPMDFLRRNAKAAGGVCRRPACCMGNATKLGMATCAAMPCGVVCGGVQPGRSLIQPRQAPEKAQTKPKSMDQAWVKRALFKDSGKTRIALISVIIPGSHTKCKSLLTPQAPCIFRKNCCFIMEIWAIMFLGAVFALAKGLDSNV